MGAFRFPRGPENRIPTLDNGRAVWDSDNEKIVVGSSSGNIEIADQSDVNALEISKADKSYVEQEINTVNDQIVQNAEIANNANNVFFAKFDYQTLLAQSVTTIVDGTSSRFPQSAVIDYENGKYYIARQTTGNYQDQMIFEYDMQGNLLRNKSVPIGSGVYVEGLVYFRNASNQICFIVPVSSYGTFAVFNFDAGVLGTSFSMNGNNKIGFDNQRRYFLCGKSNNPTLDQNTYMDGIYLYDLTSVQNGTPTLVKTIDFIKEDVLAPKIQGLTMMDDVILLGRGSDVQIITALDTNGNVLYNVSHANKSIISLIGGNPDSSNQLVESEGISWIIENGVTYPIAFNCTQGKASLVKLTVGTKLTRQVYTGVNALKALKDSLLKAEDFFNSTTFDPFTAPEGRYETKSGVNSPTNSFGAIKVYEIKTTVSPRRQIKCIYNDNGDIYYNTIKTDGTPTGWRKQTYTVV